MATQADPLNDFCWLKDGPIPPVDPADLKSIWAMQEELKRDFEKRVPNRSKPRFECQHQLLQASMQPGGKCRGSLVSVVDTSNAAICQQSHRKRVCLGHERVNQVMLSSRLSQSFR